MEEERKFKETMALANDVHKAREKELQKRELGCAEADCICMIELVGILELNKALKDCERAKRQLGMQGKENAALRSGKEPKRVDAAIATQLVVGDASSSAGG